MTCCTGVPGCTSKFTFIYCSDGIPRLSSQRWQNIFRSYDVHTQPWTPSMPCMICQMAICCNTENGIRNTEYGVQVQYGVYAGVPTSKEVERVVQHKYCRTHLVEISYQLLWLLTQLMTMSTLPGSIHQVHMNIRGPEDTVEHVFGLKIFQKSIDIHHIRKIQGVEHVWWGRSCCGTLRFRGFS